MASTRQPTKPVATIEKDGDDLVHETPERLKTLEFEYTPLPSPRAFRVLVLLPGPPNGRLEGRLEVHDLDAPSTAGSYAGISYAWNPSNHDRLFVGSERIPASHDIHNNLNIRHPVFFGSKRLLVSTSLYNLLRRLRLPDESYTWWVDAICINQEDLDERARQVLVMRDIYTLASHVLLWLGEEDDETEMAFALTEKLAHHPAADPEKLTIGIPMDFLDLVSGSGPERLGLPPMGASDYRALFALLDRPVFRRSWVVQEVALAVRPPVVLCGSHNMVFAELVTGIGFLGSCGWLELLQAEAQEEDSGHMANIGYAGDIMRIRSEPLEDGRAPHMELMGGFEATDPRDNIYAMLGLMRLADMPGESRALLQPDYTRSVEDVYRDATVALILAEESLTILSLARPGIRPADYGPLPSWVPDYGGNRRGYASLLGNYPETSPYRASGPTATPGSVAVPGEPRKLRLRAFRVGVVSAVAAEDPTLCQEAQVTEWQALARRLGPTYAATGEEAEVALWRTLVGGVNGEDRAGGREGFGHFVKATFRERIAHGPDLDHMLRGYQKFTMAWVGESLGRRLFLTRDGLMGKGVPAVKAGDEVYVVAGSMVPFLVRRDGREGGLWGIVMCMALWRASVWAGTGSYGRIWCLNDTGETVLLLAPPSLNDICCRWTVFKT